MSICRVNLYSPRLESTLLTRTCSSPSPTATTTVTQTPGNVASATTTGGLVVPTARVALDCPNLDTQGLQIITISNTTFRFTPKCGVDYVGNDIAGTIVYSFHDCLQSCAITNLILGQVHCVAVHFVADMVSSLARDYANCWLKNGTSTPNLGGENLVVSALLSSVG
jgi:hypothetical protein